MKRFFAVAALMGMCCAGVFAQMPLREGVKVDGDRVTVRQRAAGGLSKSITPEVQAMLRVLVVDGNVNKDDLKFIKKLASRNKVVNVEGKRVDAWMDVDLGHAHLLG